MQLLYLIKVVLLYALRSSNCYAVRFQRVLSHTKLNTYVFAMSSYSLNVNMESKYPAPVQKSVLTTC